MRPELDRGLAVSLVIVLLSGCGSIKEKSAPCKRPSELTALVNDPRRDCGAMARVNDPNAAFVVFGIDQPPQ